MVPKLSMPITDVRDVAGAHIAAMTSPKAPGKKRSTSFPGFLRCLSTTREKRRERLGSRLRNGQKARCLVAKHRQVFFCLPTVINLIINYNSSRLLGNRYIAITTSIWMRDMAVILDEEFRPLGKLHSEILLFMAW